MATKSQAVSDGVPDGAEAPGIEAWIPGEGYSRKRRIIMHAVDQFIDRVKELGAAIPKVETFRLGNALDVLVEEAVTAGADERFWDAADNKEIRIVTIDVGGSRGAVYALVAPDNQAAVTGQAECVVTVLPAAKYRRSKQTRRWVPTKGGPPRNLDNGAGEPGRYPTLAAALIEAQEEDAKTIRATIDMLQPTEPAAVPPTPRLVGPPEVPAPPIVEVAPAAMAEATCGGDIAIVEWPIAVSDGGDETLDQRRVPWSEVASVVSMLVARGVVPQTISVYRSTRLMVARTITVTEVPR
jgi:hypothetical protein